MKKTTKIIIFIATIILFLTGFLLYFSSRDAGLIMSALPLKEELKGKASVFAKLFNYINETNQERTFLVLLQNNLELRPGGGFIGSFAIVKIDNTGIKDIAVHDTGNFDGRIPDSESLPFTIMQKTLGIDSWKLRDSNMSPDFETNAKKAEYFYKLGDGQETFDAVIGVTSDIFTELLKITGPITITGYPGVYTADNAVIQLEKQVEIDYVGQKIEQGDRKKIMTDLTHEIIKKLYETGTRERLDAAKIILHGLDTKIIQLYFKDEEINKSINEIGWGGLVDESWQDNYLLVVDANLNAFKSDFYIDRSYQYTIDYTKPRPHIKLEMTYNHTAKQKDWMTKDYQSFTRVYIPNDSWFIDVTNRHGEAPVLGEEFGKKYIGFLLQVKLGEQKTFTVDYDLPERLNKKELLLKIQKQAGMRDVPVKIIEKFADGTEKEHKLSLTQDSIVR